MATPRPRDIELINDIVTKSKVFMDTCSLMHKHYPEFEPLLFSALHSAGTYVIVPIKVIEELNKHAQSSNEQASKLAQYALKSLAQNKYLVNIKGEDNENFADNVFQTQFAKFRLQYNLTLITQDIALAHDILNLNSITSQRSPYTIKVFRITSYGTLGINDGDINRYNSYRGGNTARNTAPQHSPSPLFSSASRITSEPDRILPSTVIPQEGESLRTSTPGTSVKLTKLLGVGGEGAVYETNIPDLVCKIYNDGKRSSHRLEKLKKMVGSGFRYPGICWPTDIVLNREGQIVGYLMPRAKGFELQRSVFVPKLLQMKFPDWDRSSLVRLSVTILEMISCLHRNNIIIGDINPLNILVATPTEVYFVDTDSFQIENLPCAVGTINFTAPEIQQKNFHSFLRTLGNEHFAVATLLFMIMLPGKPPYSQLDGNDPVSNIKNMDFSYPLGDKTNSKTPDGAWRFCWSHLPYKLKEAFYHTFRYDGDHASEANRIPTEEWLNIFREYLHLLESGKFQSRDPESIKILPKRFKIPSGNIAKCKLCGQEFDADSLEKGYCTSCLYTKGDEVECPRCHKPMLYTNKLKLEGRLPNHVCKECSEALALVYATPTCLDCGKVFSIKQGEKEYYEQMGLFLPKRCPACRKKKTARLNTNEMSQKTGGGTIGNEGLFGRGNTSILNILRGLFNLK